MEGLKTPFNLWLQSNLPPSPPPPIFDRLGFFFGGGGWFFLLLGLLSTVWIFFVIFVGLFYYEILRNTNYQLDKFWQIWDIRWDLQGQITFKNKWYMEFGVNTKHVLGLPWATQLGLGHEENQAYSASCRCRPFPMQLHH